MFSLVISIVAIALVALLALAAIFYGAPAMREARARTDASTLIHQSSQILAAAEVLHVDQRRWSASVDEFVALGYLKVVPPAPRTASSSAAATLWTQPSTLVPTYWVLKAVDTDVCQAVNLKARGDNGIYAKARPGFVVQCFGTSAPFTAISTRSGVGAGLEGVIGEHGDPSIGYDPEGGGWTMPPSKGPGTGGGTDPGGNPGGPSNPGNPADRVDNGTPGGSYLDGEIQVTLPDRGGISANSVNIGNLGDKAVARERFQFTNVGTKTWTATGVTVGADLKLAASNCAGTFEPQHYCVITVEAGPFQEVTASRPLESAATLETNKGKARAAVVGTVNPSPPATIQVGMETGDSEDTLSQFTFPDTLVGQTSFKRIRLQNQGASVMTFNAPGISSVAPYTVSESTCGTTLAVGAYCSVKLTFAPTAIQAYSSSAYLFRVQANGQTVSVRLAGNGVPPPAAGVSFSTSALDWSQVNALGSYEQTVSIKHLGTAPQTFAVKPVVTEGAAVFDVKSTTCANTLTTGQSCTFVVRFSPDDALAFKGKVELQMTGGVVQSLPLTGTAANPLRSTTVTLPAAHMGTEYSNAPELSSAWTLEGSTIDRQYLVLSIDPATPLPPGLSFNPSTGKLSGVPQEITPTSGVPIRVLARYQGKFTNEQTFTLVTKSAAVATWNPGVAGISYSPNGRTITVPTATTADRLVGLTVSPNAGKWYTEISVEQAQGVLNIGLGQSAFAASVGRYYDMRYADNAPWNQGTIDATTMGFTTAVAAKNQPWGLAVLIDASNKRITVMNKNNCALSTGPYLNWTKAGVYTTLFVTHRRGTDTAAAKWTIGHPDDPGAGKCKPDDYQWLAN